MGTPFMVPVGIRELRDALSRHLQTVANGGTVTVTDHGRAVARIVPIDRPSKLDELIASGRATPAGAPKSPTRSPIEVNGTVSDIIVDQRR